MDFNQYQALARRTQNNTLSMRDKQLHATFGMASEVGEIHSIEQKHFQGHAVDRGEQIKEAGDLLWFLAEYADTLDVTLEQIAQKNIDKLKRRYPDGFEEERSVHRQE